MRISEISLNIRVIKPTPRPKQAIIYNRDQHPTIMVPTYYL